MSSRAGDRCSLSEREMVDGFMRELRDHLLRSPRKVHDDVLLSPWRHTGVIMLDSMRAEEHDLWSMKGRSSVTGYGRHLRLEPFRRAGF